MSDPQFVRAVDDPGSPDYIPASVQRIMQDSTDALMARYRSIRLFVHPEAQGVSPLVPHDQFRVQWRPGGLAFVYTVAVGPDPVLLPRASYYCTRESTLAPPWLMMELIAVCDAGATQPLSILREVIELASSPASLPP